MSDYERNKGVLKPVNVDTEHFTDEDYEIYCDNGFYVIDGNIYLPSFEVKGETSCDSFEEVEVQEDGSIRFHTLHYNGGGCLQEVIEDSLRRIS